VKRKKRYQDPDLRVERGRYRIQYRDTDGRRRTKTFGRVGEIALALAKHAKNEFLRQINNDVTKGLRRDRTLGDLIEQWMRSEFPTIDRPATQKSFLWTFGKLADMKNAPLAVLTKPDFQQWIFGLGLAPASLRVVRANISSVLEAGRDWGWIEVNPVAGRFKLPKIARKERVILRPQQVQELSSFLDFESRTVFLLAVLTGLRKGELKALEWADIQPPWVSVSKTVNCESWVGPPKSAKSNRKVELGPLAIRTLEAWRKVSTGRLVFSSRQDHGQFRSLDQILHSRIRPLAQKLGLPAFTWHTLRHTYNTWGHVAGVDAVIMRDLMGHSSVTINQDVYSHVRQLKPTGAAHLIESLLEPQSGTPLLGSIC
jgi:integrase